MIYIILFLGTILRLISLNQSLWLDEATTSNVASHFSFKEILTVFSPNDFHPPLYYMMMKIWVNIFGNSEISLRIPSIIFGVATIYIVYKISKNYLAPLLLATSGLAIYYSQEARMYSLTAFLVTLVFYLFISKKWVWFSIILAILGMTDYVALFILPIFWLIGYKDWKKLAISYTPLTIGFLIWLPIFIKQIQAGISVTESNWWQILGVSNLKNIFLIPIKFVIGRISFDNKLLYGSIVMVVLLLYGYLIYKVRKASKILWLWLVLPIVIGMLISFKIPTLSYFRFLFCLPALYVLISHSKSKLIWAVLIINILSSSYYLLDSRFQREDWRSAAQAIGKDKIVFPSNSQKEALIYYRKEDQIVGSDQLTKNDREIWLSRYVWEIFDPIDSARKKLEDLGYNKVSETNFNGVVFWKYAYSN